MRVNLPITGREYTFPAEHTLVSTTDLKGRIVYCNLAFIEVSGFSKDELLGKSHNLVRHPDMPQEAFRDMWHTISSGLPWSAMVKNRRKNGDHYWVMANVTPLIDGSVVSGYMSVRTKPSPEQIKAADALYETMRAEASRGKHLHVLDAGRVIRQDWLGHIAESIRLGMRGRLWTLFAMQGLLVALASLGGIPAALAVAALLSAAAAWVACNLTVSPVRNLVRFANRMAGGDLSQLMMHVRSDEMGQMAKALNQLNVNLQSVVRDARNEARNMQFASEDIASRNNELARRTESQAGSLQLTAVSIEEIKQTVEHTASLVKHATHLTSAATDIAGKSNSAVDAVARTMEAIREAFAKVTDIIQIIDSIAFQTNILSLNAAVEAARAGEQGRGFGVVAAEVRALAQRSAGAAKEIKSHIEAAATEVQSGNQHMGYARTAMQESVAAVQSMSSLIGKIGNSTSEQLDGISQINAAAANLNGITQQNAAMVEQIAVSASDLRGQAETLTDTVSVFRLETSKDSFVLLEAGG
ncbi:methyl-accepting chemotaxis sensory transducer with Pas/Pac sensor [Acidovorax delafieldii 2AN]|uniref:Methyl-accepting chemotaxis sensory transducer with Pas/Pac sensor n=1 Tax=Acidovorax delafieldii 2AN TaxID=573060 RepID=C5T964_ACIDE|nr:PAS domain-containing methyl-accepting chemotaxis protein [Acidovorax delafieldii]EER58978.1 methyl-accepting chemotaxis sensory transducer with Pas/Pac sensor [Acidovorax delafieldii 2AN]